METIASLLQKHTQFWENLSRSEWKSYMVAVPKPPVVTAREVKKYAAENRLSIPDDITEFWCTPLVHYRFAFQSSLSLFASWRSGCDWHPLATVQEWRRMNLQSSDQWQEEQKDDLPHQLTLNGSYPQFILNTFPQRGKAGIYCRKAADVLVEEAITPTFTGFFQHWLAAGCFVQGNADAYLNLIDKWLPLRIPSHENRWLQFYRTYKID